MATKILRPFIKFKHTFGFDRRQNFSKSCSLPPELELAFNNQINLEFFASFTYLAMAAYFGRQSVSLPGCHKYFTDQVQDEREHGQKFIDYLNRRGNAVLLQAIPAPTNQAWDSPLAAFREALQLEKCVTQKLVELRKTSEDMGDIWTCILLDNEFLDNQLEESDRLSRYAAQLEKIGPDQLGIYLFDRYLLKDTK